MLANVMLMFVPSAKLNATELYSNNYSNRAVDNWKLYDATFNFDESSHHIKTQTLENWWKNETVKLHPPEKSQ